MLFVVVFGCFLKWSRMCLYKWVFSNSGKSNYLKFRVLSCEIELFGCIEDHFFDKDTPEILVSLERDFDLNWVFFLKY